MGDPILTALARLERKVDALLEDSGIEQDVDICPFCGENRLEPTPTLGRPSRMTCLTPPCGKSFDKEAING